MRLRIVAGLVMLVLVMPAAAPSAQEPAPAGIPESLRSSVDAAVALVKPALVRIEVVTPDYYEGREVKYESSGSGVIRDLALGAAFFPEVFAGASSGTAGGAVGAPASFSFFGVFFAPGMVSSIIGLRPG